jgi:flagellar protein FliO/FliZ
MIALSLLLEPQPVWAAADAGGGTQALLVASAVVVVVAVFAWLVLRGTIRLGGRKAKASVSVESGCSLGERRALAIVSVEGRRLLLGLTPTQISLLMELSSSPPDFSKALERSVSSPAGGHS